MRIISEVEARNRLKPHHGPLAASIDSAWARWDRGLSVHFPMPSRRTRPTILHDLIIDECRQRLGNAAGINIVSSQGRDLIVIDNVLLIHFKQLNRKLQSRNYPTDMAERFYAQEPLLLPNVPDVCRVTIGYIPSTATNSISAIYALLQVRKTIAWSYEIKDTHKGTLLTFPQLTIIPPQTTSLPTITKPIQRLVRAKTNKTEKKTDGKLKSDKEQK